MMASNPADNPAQNQQDSISPSDADRLPNASDPHVPATPVSRDARSSAVSPTQIREDLVATAVKFLQNAKVRERPIEQRRAFLERKGMNQVEIELAMMRSGTSAAEAPSLPVVNHSQPSFTAGGPAVIAVPTSVASSWSRLRDVTNMLVLLTGAVYAVYHLYKRFVVPAVCGGGSEKVDPLVEVRRSVDELRRSMAEVVASITETQSLMRTQQRQLDDVIRCSSALRGPDELDRMNVSEVKDELKSLKALLLNRKQFPALPTMTPVIPAWQLQQNSADNAESRAETKPFAAEVENCENQTDTEHSLAASAETNVVVNHESADETVMDKLDNLQLESVQNDISDRHFTTDATATENDLLSNGLDSNTADHVDSTAVAPH